MANTERKDAIMLAISKNKELHNKLVEIQRKAQADGLSKEEYAKKFQDEMKVAGIEAAVEEIVGFLTPDETVELSKDELDNVAGGGCFHSDEEYKRNGCKMPCSNYC